MYFMKVWIWVISIITGIGLIACVHAQGSASSIIVNVIRHKGASLGISSSLLINGYCKSIHGQTIEYHSSHPDAVSALLVRTQRDVHSIAWDTDTLVSLDKSDYYNLIWLAGIEKGGWEQSTLSRSFDLIINGTKWFTFKNLKDSTASEWTIRGSDGSELRFQTTMHDRFDDLFGYMLLKLPKSKFSAGYPLHLEVVGENADTPDWYMTFRYHFNFTPNVRMEPALFRTTTQPAQILRLSLDNLIPGRSIEIETSNQPPIKKDLNVGGNIFYLPIQEITSGQSISIQFEIDGTVINTMTTVISPVRHRDIYLLSYSHNDIGYTDLQPNVERKQMQNIDIALHLIKQTKDFPSEARYKWNMEVIWALESYLNRASNEKRQEVIAAIKDGSIGLNALYANVLTGLASSTEMLHFTEYARRFTKEYSIPITTACISDIPGFSWGLVTTLAQSGVKYFSSAPNSGDRVGYVYESLGDKPFYWTSQSGEEKVLMWLAAASYSSFHEGELHKLGDEKILKLMRKLDQDEYPYDIVQLPYTVGGDNGTPDSTLSAFVKAWNERYASPRLIIATHQQMFQDFETKYGATLQTLKGDFTPYWEDGAVSTAYETALNRQAVDRLIQSEALWSMRSPPGFPEKEYRDAWRNVILYDEHTWGANVSVSDPDSSFVKEQWRIKRQFALDADSLSRILLTKAIAGSSPNKNAIEVYNTSSWNRSDVILIPKELSTRGDVVVDADGKEIPSRRLTTGELAAIVKNIPPLSSKIFSIRNGAQIILGGLPFQISNIFMDIYVDPITGTITEIKDNIYNKNIIKMNDYLNELFYVQGKNSDSAKHLSNIRLIKQENGPVVSSILIEADAPGCKKFSTEYRLYEGINRLDIINYLDKKSIREKEGVHFGFPFKIPNGILRYDVANSIVKPETDQIPGSCKNFFSVQSVVDVSNDTCGITWATPDAPLIEIGAINAEKPWMKTIEQSQTFYSYVMNNYWHTNYKADQEGPVTFRYAIQPHFKYRSEDALRFGAEQRQPLIVAAATDLTKPVSSLCTVEPQSVLINSIKPIAGSSAWLAQLYNASDETQHASVRWNKSIPVKMSISDIFEKNGENLNNEIEIPPHGSVYVRINRKK